jgi:hypothetical protein
MGQTITIARDNFLEQEVTQADSAAPHVLEQLSFLVNAANAKLDKYQADLNEMWLDSTGTTAKKMVPGRRALRWERGYHVGIHKEELVHPWGDGIIERDGLDDIIDRFFSATSVKDVTDGKSIITGFKKHVRSTLYYILTNTNAGEQEDQRFFVFVQHNAIIRIDIKLWRYNFNSTEVMAKSTNVLAYVFCVSVVNHMDLSVDELTYLLSEHAGDCDVKKYVDYLLGVWKKIYEIKKQVNSFKIEWETKFQQLEIESKKTTLGYRQSRLLNAPPSPPSSQEEYDEEHHPRPFSHSREVSY